MKNHLMRGLVSSGVIAVAACSDTSGPSGTEYSLLESLVPLDVAETSGDAFIADVAELWLDLDVGLGDMFAASAEVRGQSSRARTVTKTFYDADGNEQDDYDKVTTASVHIVSESSGERSRSNAPNPGLAPPHGPGIKLSRVSRVTRPLVQRTGSGRSRSPGVITPTRMVTAATT